MLDPHKTVDDINDWVHAKWGGRVVQLSVYGGVVFYIVANPSVFKHIEGLLPKRITKLNQLVLHSVIFAILMYIGTTLFLDPVLSRVGLIENYENKKTHES